MMRGCQHSIAGAAALLLLAGSAVAQHAVSARAGMINVAEGDVFFVDDRGAAPQRVEPRPNELVSMKEGQTLRTEEGRAEVLLTPGAFLRLGEASAVRLDSSRLSSVKLELLDGGTLIDIVELLPDNSVLVRLAGAEVELEKAGLYRFDAAPPRVRVFNGQAEVRAAGLAQTLKGGRELRLEGAQWAVRKFDADKETDSLYRWSKRRSGYIAMANVSAARQAGSFWGASGFRGGTWLWNPFFGFATYVPWSDTVMSPFGYYYYTPRTVYQVYYPPRSAPALGGGFDHGGPAFAGSMPPRSAGSSYTPAAPVSASAPSAPPPGAGSVGSRSGGAAGGSVGGTGGVRAGSGGRGN
ncbi:MAG: hypothetical protein ACOYX1_15250 [Acidobacteriota bacterium]